MTRWKTDEVVEQLRNALRGVHIQKCEPGGDVDVENIIVTMMEGDSGDQLFIAGFKTDGYYGDNRSDVDVEMVELTCGKDSRGGLRGVFEPETIRAYAEAMIALQGMGFEVVPRLKDYF